MKKILSLVIVFALLIQGVASSVILSNAVVDELVVVEPTVESIVLFPDERYPYEVNTNGCYDDMLGAYIYEPPTDFGFNLILNDGSEYPIYNFFDLYRSPYGGDFYWESDQEENPWGVGTHSFILHIQDASVEIPVEIVEEYISPSIKSISIADWPEPIYENTSGYEEYEFDGTVWYRYNTPSPLFCVVDEWDCEYYIRANEFYDMFHVNPRIEDGQSKDTPWGVGKNPVTMRISGYTFTYNVTVRAFSVSSISIFGDAPSIYENTNGYGYTDYVYDEETWEIISSRYIYHYDVPSDVLFILSTADSEEIWATTEEILTKFNGTFESDQTNDNVWGVGTHYFDVSVGGASYTLPITIESFPIESIEAPVATVYEGIDCARYSEPVFDPETGDFLYLEYWNHYEACPETVTVHFTDGTSAEYGIWDLANEWNISPSYEDPQSYWTPWGVGENYVTITFGPVQFDYVVNVVENPIASVSFAKLPAKTSFTSQEVITAEGAVLRIEYTDGTHDDVTLTNQFTKGEMNFNCAPLGKAVTIENANYTDDETGKQYVKALVAGKSAEYEIEVVEVSPASSIVLSEEGGELYIEYVIDGVTTKEKVLDFTAEYMENHWNYPLVTINGTIALESGIYPVNLSYTDTNADKCFNLSGITLEILGSAGSIASSKWLEAVLLFKQLENGINYSVKHPECPITNADINGEITSDNIVFATALALSYWRAIGSETLPCEYSEMTSTLVISADELATFLSEFYSVSISASDIANMIPEMVSGDWVSIYIPFEYAYSPVDCASEFSVSVIENGSGYLYEITAKISDQAGDPAVVLKGVVTENGTVNSIVFEEPVIEKPAIPGDADGDGELTARDLKLLVQQMVGIVEFDKVTFARMDLDGDGELTARDHKALIMRIVSM